MHKFIMVLALVGLLSGCRNASQQRATEAHVDAVSTIEAKAEPPAAPVVGFQGMACVPGEGQCYVLNDTDATVAAVSALVGITGWDLHVPPAEAPLAWPRLSWDGSEWVDDGMARTIDGVLLPTP